MGILITRDGSVTLPCALIILGVPLFAIGKHAKDSASSGHIYRYGHGSVSGSGDGAAPISLPFQYILGIVLLSLAFICILLELLTTGVNSSSSDKDRSSSSGKYKLNKLRRNINRSAREVRDDEDYEETKLLARHYTRLEILKKLNDICKEIVRQRYQHNDDNIDDNTKESKISSDSGASIVTMKQKRNVIVYLNSLALQLRYHQDDMKAKGDGKNNGHGDSDSDEDENALYLTCQEAAYHTLSTFHAMRSTSTSTSASASASASASTTKDRSSTNMNIQMDHDRVQSAAMALLALSAKHESVRERNMHEADVYGLDLPIKVMQSSLQILGSIKRDSDNDNDKVRVDEDILGEGETVETIAAELQRKCCLYLGALADSTNANSATSTTNSTMSLSTVIAQEDGLEAILNTMGWFRFHSHVINWALWAVFHICYDHIPNQCLFVRLDGIQKVCMVMDNIVNDWNKAKAKATCSEALNDNRDDDNDALALAAMRDEAKEVARHGIAILFDLLRYDEKKGDHYNSDNKSYNSGAHAYTARKDFMHVRRIALNAGMHVTVKNAMMAFDDNTEIMMMGQQMLIATGYNGDIPKFEGKLVPR